MDMFDAKEMAHRRISVQIETLQRVLLDYADYQQLVMEMRHDDSFNPEEVKTVLGGFQDMIDMVYRDLLVVTEDSIAQQVRYWRNRSDMSFTTAPALATR